MTHEVFIELVKAWAPWVASILLLSGVLYNTKKTTAVARAATVEANTMTNRKDTIADRDSFILTLTSRIDKLEARQTISEAKIETLTGVNGELSVFGNILVRHMEENDLAHLIPEPRPEGIYKFVSTTKKPTEQHK